MILISNDDGYQAKGIQFLINIVKDYDDVLVFGAVTPTYTDRGYTVTVANMGCDTIGRQRESSGGSYLNGLRNFKTFFEFKDLLDVTYSKYIKAWLQDDPRDPEEMLVAEIRRVKPEVVITGWSFRSRYCSSVIRLIAS